MAPDAHVAGEVGPARRAEPLQRGLVGVERMPAEKEADRVELALELFRLRPWARPNPQRRRLRLAEQRVLARRLLRDAAVRDRKHGLDRREDDGAVALEFIERPRGGEALERLLVDEARIEPARHVGERGERVFRRALSPPPPPALRPRL